MIRHTAPSAWVVLLPLVVAWGAASAGAQSSITPTGPRRAATAAPRGGTLFATPFLHRTRLQPSALAFGELDADGLDDMVVASMGNDVLTVHLGQGGGRFSPGTSHGGGNDPRTVELFDMDGDGDRDIIVLSRFDRRVGILANLGQGAFGTGVFTPLVSGNSNDLRVGDVDGDGDYDVVVPMITTSTNGGFRVLVNNGAGVLTNTLPYLAALTLPQTIELADLDGDGDLDVALPSFEASGVVHVVLNLGGGTFGAAAVYPAGDSIGRLRAADMDGDGDLDLVVSHDRPSPTPGSFSVLVNSGGAVFPSRIEYPAASDVFHVALGDIDGDGDVDVAASSSDLDALIVHRNLGGGSFSPGEAYPGVVNPWEARFRDLDGDGKQELSVCSFGTEAVYGFINRGDGTLLHTPPELSPRDSAGVVLGDLDGDHLPELVATYSGLGDVHVRENLGGGSFAPAVLHAAPPQPVAPLIADFDRDGLDDVIAVGGVGFLSWFQNQGGGLLTPRIQVPAGADYFELFTLGDLDGDGDLDGAGSQYGQTTLAVLQNTGAALTPTLVPLPGYCGEIAIEDLDGDGRRDVALAVVSGTTSVSGIYVLWNLGGGALSAPVQVAINPNLAADRTLVPVDIDADGDIDFLSGPFVLYGAASSIPYVARNQGGTFTVHPLPASPYEANSRHVDVADVDRDGRLDILMSVSRFTSQGACSVFRGDASGSFEYFATYSTGVSDGGIEAADLDGDGDVDLLATTTHFPISTSPRHQIVLWNRIR